MERYVILIIFCLFFCVNGCSSDIEYSGKVIDAETLKPIEGAVVIAIWEKSRSAYVDTVSDFKSSKETLTDKNGDWIITGPEGSEDKIFPSLITLLGFYVTESPRFVFFKPGYVQYGTPGCFGANPTSAV